MQTIIALPNGERRSISHGSPSRTKSYRITGLTQAEAQSWVDVFEANEGIRLVILDDDQSAVYAGYLNKMLPQSREQDIFSIDLEFVEIRV